MRAENEKVAIAWTLYFDFSFYSMYYKIFGGHFELLDFDPWFKNHTLIFFWNTL